MQYVKGVCLPIPLFGADPNLWYPVLQGDESYVREVGDPIELEDLLTLLEEGDSLVSYTQEIDEIENQFPDRFIRRRSFGASEAKLEFCLDR
jgi:hypothetical protein